MGYIVPEADSQLILALSQQMSLFLVLAYLFTKTPIFRPLIEEPVFLPRRLGIYLVFSGFCLLGTFFSEQTHGVFANTRAVGAVLGGLLGGPLTGFLVGLTGGIHRYSLGGFTDLACMVGTVVEGLIGGVVHFWLLRKSKPEHLFNPYLVGSVVFLAVLLEMFIIILLAPPLPMAIDLVYVIAPPMLLVNTVGAILLMSMIRDQRRMAEKLSASATARALAEKTVNALANGFNEESAAHIAKIVREETRVAAVAITDCDKLMAFNGEGADHHLPGDPISSKITLAAIEENHLVFADGIEHQYRCSISPRCELGSCLVIPLQGAEGVVGTMKLYERRNTLFRNTNRTLGERIARLLSHQLLNWQLQQQQQLLTQSELKLLQAQVNPHFLFNALNTIAAITRRDSDKARSLIKYLATFLRINLRRSADEVSLQQELKQVEAYLKIEQARFGERLKVVFEIDPILHDTKMPTFTLQPLVENAIKHGLANMLEQGVVTIRAYSKAQQVIIEVEDNAGAWPANPESEGIGMSLVDKRIKARFGQSYGITVAAEKEQYTRIQILLPKPAMAHKQDSIQDPAP